MKLYYFPLSTYSQKALLALHEKGLEYDAEVTNLFDPDAAKAYREVYPLGKVPLLVDGDHRVPESSIIVEYLDWKFPDTPRLIPAEPVASRQTRFHDRMCDLYLNDSIVTLLFQSWKPQAERDPEAIAKAHERAGVIYEFMGKRLAEREWMMDSGYSLADIAATPALFYAQQVKPFDDRPTIQAYWERLSARPSWQKVMAEAKPHLERLQKAS